MRQKYNFHLLLLIYQESYNKKSQISIALGWLPNYYRTPNYLDSTLMKYKNMEDLFFAECIVQPCRITQTVWLKTECWRKHWLSILQWLLWQNLHYCSHTFKIGISCLQTKDSFHVCSCFKFNLCVSVCCVITTDLYDGFHLLKTIKGLRAQHNV